MSSSPAPRDHCSSMAKGPDATSPPPPPNLTPPLPPVPPLPSATAASPHGPPPPFPGRCPPRIWPWWVFSRSVPREWVAMPAYPHGVRAPERVGGWVGGSGVEQSCPRHVCRERGWGRGRDPPGCCFCSGGVEAGWLGGAGGGTGTAAPLNPGLPIERQPGPRGLRSGVPATAPSCRAALSPWRPGEPPPRALPNPQNRCSPVADMWGAAPRRTWLPPAWHCQWGLRCRCWGGGGGSGVLLPLTLGCPCWGLRGVGVLVLWSFGCPY